MIALVIDFIRRLIGIFRRNIIRQMILAAIYILIGSTLVILVYTKIINSDNTEITSSILAISTAFIVAVIAAPVKEILHRKEKIDILVELITGLKKSKRMGGQDAEKIWNVEMLLQILSELLARKT